MTKSPRDAWPEASPGLEIVLLAGTHQAGELSGRPDMVIRGGEGVVIEGSMRPGGGEDPCSLRVHDGAHRLRILGPLEVRGSEGRGLRLTGSDDVQVADIYSHHHGIESIILGNCPRARLCRLHCAYSRDTGATSPDRRHGLYVSGNASGTIIEDLKAERVTGSGLQVNGAGLGFIVFLLQARRLTFSECGSGGTPPISLMAVRLSVFSEFCVYSTPQDRWAVLFADGHGAAYSCRGNDFLDYYVPPRTHAVEEEGSCRNEFDPGEGWDPDDPPEPEPEPEPPEYIVATCLNSGCTHTHLCPQLPEPVGESG